MIKKIRHGNIIWLDLTNPSREELNGVHEEFSIPKKIFNRKNNQPAFRQKDKYIITTCFLSNIFKIDKQLIIKDLKVNILIRDNLMITIHPEPLICLEKLEDILDNKINNKNQEIIILRRIINGSFRNLELAINDINASLGKIGKRIFNDKYSILELMKIKHLLKETEKIITQQARWLNIPKKDTALELNKLQKKLEVMEISQRNNNNLLHSLFISRLALDKNALRKKIKIFLILVILLLILIIGLYLY